MCSIDYYICFMFGDWFSSLVSQAGRSQAQHVQQPSICWHFHFCYLCTHTPSVHARIATAKLWIGETSDFCVSLEPSSRCPFASHGTLNLVSGGPGSAHMQPTKYTLKYGKFGRRSFLYFVPLQYSIACRREKHKFEVHIFSSKMGGGY